VAKWEHWGEFFTHEFESVHFFLVKEGITLSDQVTIQGDLLTKLKMFNGVSSAQFDMGLTIPIFPGQSPDVILYLEASGEFPIKPNFQFTGEFSFFHRKYCH
jgi:hypothetical protein